MSARKSDKKRSKPYTFRLHPDSAKRLEERCESIGISPGEYAKRLIHLHLGIPDEPPPVKWEREDNDTTLQSDKK